MNLVILKGNVGKEPVTKQVKEHLVCQFSLATKGGRKDTTDWHNVTAWGKTAEIISKYVQRGSPLLVQGRIEYRKYTSKEGVEKFVTDIVAERVELLSSRKESDDSTSQNQGEAGDDFNIPF
jgi:single-strand DNA-binding protein